jgi:2-hydroxychromene-2-carboxylate isomerase
LPASFAQIASDVVMNAAPPLLYLIRVTKPLTKPRLAPIRRVQQDDNLTPGEERRMALHIDYYASLNSPWTHMGAARIEAMAMANNASLRIFPVDFGTIFPASGGLPLPKRAPQRQAYRLMELRRWRDYLGVPINIQPKHFPSSEQLSASCVIALRETMGDQPAIKLAHRVLKAVWQDELNPGDSATLATLIKDIGLDPDAVMKLGADPRWADMRTSDTKAALDRGVFGAPSYVIGDEIFWGQDRLPFVERRLARG